METNKSQHTLLVDGNSLFKTTFEASFKRFMDKPDDDTHTEMSIKRLDGVYAFLLKLRSTIKFNKFNSLKIVFDGKDSGTLRQKIYPDYKRKRKERQRLLTEEQEYKTYESKRQADLLKKYLNHFCFWYEDKCVEADDVIAYYVKNKKPDERVTIMTGDVDIMQLIDDDVFVLYLNKQFKTKTRAVKRYEKAYYNRRQHLIFNKNKFLKFFDYPSENITLIKTICGDDSDEIKNIKGVRETTLFNLIPEIKERKVELSYVLEKCQEIIESKSNGYKKAQNIVEGNTDGIQGEKILEINKRIVDLNSNEFITDECISNINKNGFLSGFKFKPKDPVGLLNKMREDGLYKFIDQSFGSYKKSQPLKKFFKPFKNKTFV